MADYCLLLEYSKPCSYQTYTGKVATQRVGNSVAFKRPDISANNTRVCDGILVALVIRDLFWGVVFGTCSFGKGTPMNMKSIRSSLSTIALLLLASSIGFAQQDVQPCPDNPTGTLGCQLVAWSWLQNPEPTERPVLLSAAFIEGQRAGAAAPSSSAPQTAAPQPQTAAPQPQTAAPQPQTASPQNTQPGSTSPNGGTAPNTMSPNQTQPGSSPATPGATTPGGTGPNSATPGSTSTPGTTPEGQTAPGAAPSGNPQTPGTPGSQPPTSPGSDTAAPPNQ
jgi:hypothetical protein